MNLFKSGLSFGMSSSVTRRIAQFCLLTLPITTMTAFVAQPSFADPNPNGCGDGAGDCVKYNLQTQAQCVQVGTQAAPNPPAGNAPGWYLGLNSEIDSKNLKGKIIAYQIQWFSGAWSGWYVPGVNDLDVKYNRNNNTMRRMWSYFSDHQYIYIICKQP
jgi:hypothetical protein